MFKPLSSVAVVLVGLQSALFLHPEATLPPASWAVISCCIWLLFVLSKGGWSQLSANEVRRFFVGVSAAVFFLQFLQYDDEFEGWSSVYYFCGSRLQYCTCGFRWNLYGWLKAAVLWWFVLTATLGAQQLIIQAGLGGLLPGEEAVTRESFISICWRLIPYWLNNWEQQWGAEVSSMTFELPHFAVELLVILPCCQIICSRLKLLVTPQVNVLLGQQQPQQQAQAQAQGPGQRRQQGLGGAGLRQFGADPEEEEQREEGDDDEEEEDEEDNEEVEEVVVGDAPIVREDFAPNVLRGFWERRPEQRRFIPRVRSNLRVLAFLTGLTALAAFNATLVPLYLEGQAAGAPDTPMVVLAAKHAAQWRAGRAAEAAAAAAAAAAANATATLQTSSSTLSSFVYDPVHGVAGRGNVTALSSGSGGSSDLQLGVMHASSSSSSHGNNSVANPVSVGAGGSPGHADAVHSYAALEAALKQLRQTSMVAHHHAHSMQREVLANSSSANSSTSSANTSATPQAVSSTSADSSSAADGEELPQPEQEDAYSLQSDQHLVLYLHFGQPDLDDNQQQLREFIKRQLSQQADLQQEQDRLRQDILGLLSQQLPGQPPELVGRLAKRLEAWTVLRGCGRRRRQIKEEKQQQQLLQGQEEEEEKQREGQEEQQQQQQREGQGEQGEQQQQLGGVAAAADELDFAPYWRNVEKHATELRRMQDPEHRSLIPLVESALAIMRLSCEKYFVLVAIYLAFLLFRDAPRPARAVIRVIARVSGTFQKVILFAFPAICWLYNAGLLFSLFVSVVFWGGPLLAMYDTLRVVLWEVSIKSLSPATAEQIERMGGSCAICWGDMAPGQPPRPHPHPHPHPPSTSTAAAAGAAAAAAPSPSHGGGGGGSGGGPAGGNAAAVASTSNAPAHAGPAVAEPATAAPLSEALAALRTREAKRQQLGLSTTAAEAAMVGARPGGAPDQEAAAAAAPVAAAMAAASPPPEGGAGIAVAAANPPSHGLPLQRQQHGYLLQRERDAQERSPSQQQQPQRPLAAAASAMESSPPGYGVRSELRRGPSESVTKSGSGNGGGAERTPPHQHDAANSVVAEAGSPQAPTVSLDSSRRSSPLYGSGGTTSGGGGGGGTGVEQGDGASVSDKPSAGARKALTLGAASGSGGGAGGCSVSGGAVQTAPPPPLAGDIDAGPSSPSAAAGCSGCHSPTTAAGGGSGSRGIAAATAGGNASYGRRTSDGRDAMAEASGHNAPNQEAGAEPVHAAAAPPPPPSEARTNATPATAAAGWALPCGHAYHHACLMQWIAQCGSSGVTPTCPMCQRGIQLQVRWRMPQWFRRWRGGGEDAEDGGATANTARRHGGAGGAAAAAAGRFGPPAPAGAVGGGGGAAAAAAAAADLAGGENLLDAVRAVAGRDAGLQVVGLLEHRREFQELLHEVQLEVPELPPDVQVVLRQQEEQGQGQGQGQEEPRQQPHQPPPPPQQQERQQHVEAERGEHPEHLHPELGPQQEGQHVHDTGGTSEVRRPEQHTASAIQRRETRDHCGGDDGAAAGGDGSCRMAAAASTCLGQQERKDTSVGNACQAHRDGTADGDEGNALHRRSSSSRDGDANSNGGAMHTTAAAAATAAAPAAKPAGPASSVPQPSDDRDDAPAVGCHATKRRTDGDSGAGCSKSATCAQGLKARTTLRQVVAAEAAAAAAAAAADNGGYGEEECGSEGRGGGGDGCSEGSGRTATAAAEGQSAASDAANADAAAAAGEGAAAAGPRPHKPRRRFLFFGRRKQQ